MSEVLLSEQDSSILTLTLNLPEKRNPISDPAMVDGLCAALEAADEDISVHCVILTGAGSSFSSGGDLKAMRTDSGGLPSARPVQTRRNYKYGIQRLPLLFQALEVPVVAAVNGHAIGAGCDLATMCDVRVAADGAKSHVRQQLGLDTEVKSYDRTAIVCNAQFSGQHKGCAFERLTQTGPLALLPYHHGRCGLVWSVNSDMAAELLELSDEGFMAELQHQLSFRMGSLGKVGRRSSYPIYQVKVPNQIAQSVVLMGNAAHAVSPVSAQGLNLAVRGIKRLVNVLNDAQKNKQSISDLTLLEKYQSQSQQDQEATMNYTDDLMTWFQIDMPLVNGLRSVGLLAVDAVPALKQYLFKRAGGLKA